MPLLAARIDASSLYRPSTCSANWNALLVMARQAVQSPSNVPSSVVHNASASRAIKVIRMIRIALPSKWHIFDDIEALLANWFSFAFRLFEIETRSTEKLFVVLRQRSAWLSPAIGINTVTLETFEAPFSIQSANNISIDKIIAFSANWRVKHPEIIFAVLFSFKLVNVIVITELSEALLTTKALLVIRLFLVVGKRLLVANSLLAIRALVGFMRAESLSYAAALK